jgi:hypothetical protein
MEVTKTRAERIEREKEMEKEYLVILKFQTDNDAEQCIDTAFKNLIDAGDVIELEVISVKETI